MKIVEEGHQFLLESYDGESFNQLIFMKREGVGYPFNVGTHAGTNCQEVIRALISRVQYLQKQIPCAENEYIIDSLRDALQQFEDRAARRHGRELIPIVKEIESLPTCKKCGHIGCEEEVVYAGERELGTKSRTDAV